LDIDGHCERGTFLYVVHDLPNHDIILGKPFLDRWDGRLNCRRGKLFLKETGSLIRDIKRLEHVNLDCHEISAAAFKVHVNHAHKSPAHQIFAASMADIQKALAPKKKPDLKTELPQQYQDFAPLFSAEKAGRLPPLRGKGIDHSIELEEKDGKPVTPPYGPLYNMTPEELLVLRKTLTELLDKNYIRVSNSPAASPVLFARKPGGGLRFCVDYRALNALTRKDRYPIPLIQETLNMISKAKWFTKLDVSAAFHKIRIAEGDEWLTAFRTRYGLFEWLVTPFGLANAPSTFQKYINWTLREYLDWFCSAYLDDILVFTDGTKEEHETHVRMILKVLEQAGLYLDISKCEFSTQSTKYLGFIIEAGKGIRMDPEKVEAIQGWQAPTTVKGVRGFLGFANFYRRFIRDYSDLTAPLTRLTKKDTPFQWTQEADDAFKKLKDLFVSEPILLQFDPDRCHGCDKRQGKLEPHILKED